MIPLIMPTSVSMPTSFALPTSTAPVISSPVNSSLRYTCPSGFEIVTASAAASLTWGAWVTGAAQPANSRPYNRAMSNGDFIIKLRARQHQKQPKKNSIIAALAA